MTSSKVSMNFREAHCETNVPEALRSSIAQSFLAISIIHHTGYMRSLTRAAESWACGSAYLKRVWIMNKLFTGRNKAMLLLT